VQAVNLAILLTNTRIPRLSQKCGAPSRQSRSDATVDGLEVGELNHAVAVVASNWTKEKMKPKTAEDPLPPVCRVFDAHIEDLFTLALLLTGSIERAESCFIRATSLAASHGPIHGTYIFSVARRCVVKAAIEAIAEEIQVCAESESQRQLENLVACATRPHEKLSDSKTSIIGNLLRLNPLRRAALILRLFERYHRKDIALQLGVSMSVAETASKRGLVEYLRLTLPIEICP
jgi:DNA-directed RNA polymerase specialized sigma24 family protein